MRRLPDRATGLLGHVARHPTLATLLMAVMIVLGLAAAPNLRAQFFPDVVIDEITVTVRWDGAGASDVDAGLVQPLGPALQAVEGVARTTARAREGQASITLDFEPGQNMDAALADVQAAVDGVTGLPDAAEEPSVTRRVWRDRVTDVVIHGPVDAEQLARHADAFAADLFARGITRTTIRGLAAPQIVAEVAQADLVRHGLTMAEIAAAIAEAAGTDPAGSLSDGTARLRTGTPARTAEALARVVLRADPGGAALTVGDVATLRTEGSTRERAYFVGDDPAISIRVDRSETGDALDVMRLVEDAARTFETGLPRGVRVDLVDTRSDAIAARLGILLDNGLMGLGLVLALLFLFLNARTAFWVAAGIPTAMLAALALMYAGGLTLNMISLFALILTLGIVVDDAIVVGEHADHLARTGMAPTDAAEAAARRMALPVFCATLTTVIAFFGLVAIGGSFGRLIADIPFTVIAVLLASLVECFLILPNHMAHALRHAGARAWYDAPSRLVNRGFERVRDRLFRPFVALVIRARYAVLALAVLALASQAAVVIRGDVPWRFFAGPERSSITGNFAMAPAATRADALAQMRLMQDAVDRVAARYAAEHGRDPLAFVLAEIGGNAGRGLAGTGDTEADRLGGISIDLIPPDDRPYSAFAFLADLQDAVERHPLAETVTFRGGRSGPGGDALDIALTGAGAAVLKAASLDLQAALARFPEVSGLEDTLAYDRAELLLSLTPRGAALGFGTADLGRALRDRLSGIEAASFPDGPRSATIRVEAPARELSADFLETLMVRAPSGGFVHLGDIVTVESRTGFSTIRRENGALTVSVRGDLSEDDPARAAEIMQALETAILPDIASRHQVGWDMAGLSEQEDAFLADARTGLLLVLLGIYLVLSWVFASWTRPLVVMAVIPFGLVGAIWGHALWDVPLSMFTVVGLLGMTGIVINDSIVLVTQIDGHARTRAMRAAIVEGAADRLRAVFLTTATTVLGLVPLLYEGSTDAEFLKPTVITLVYGLGFGMVLVLLVVPALLAVQEDIAVATRALRRGLRTPRLRGPMRAAVAAMVAWLVATMGHVAVTGTLPFALVGLVPGLGGMADATVLFLGGTAIVLAVAALAVGARRVALSARSR